MPGLNTMASKPGLKWVPKSTVMDMSYDKSFIDAYVGDAYERMFLNAALVAAPRTRKHRKMCTHLPPQKKRRVS